MTETPLLRAPLHPTGKVNKELTDAYDAANRLFRERNHVLSFQEPPAVLAAVQSMIDQQPDDVRTPLAMVMDVADRWLVARKFDRLTELLRTAPVDTWPPVVSLGLLSMVKDVGAILSFVDTYRERVAARWPDMSHLWRKS